MTSISVEIVIHSLGELTVSSTGISVIWVNFVATSVKINRPRAGQTLDANLLMTEIKDAWAGSC